MSSVSAREAREFVAGLVLSEPPPQRVREEAVAFDFTAARDQAMVVGSNVVSFMQGVTPERRQDLVNTVLLAQLAANKLVPNATDVYRWYNTYFDVLTHVGWVVQDRGFATYSEASEDFEAHKAILQVAASLLGPSAAALVVVKTTLDALASMSGDSPWITLFNRESQHANTARFQVSVVEEGANDQSLATLMAFGLEAKVMLTQVLFFKFRSSEATIKHYSGKITIDSKVLTEVREMVAAKITAFANDYVRALPIG